LHQLVSQLKKSQIPQAGDGQRLTALGEKSPSAEGLHDVLVQQLDEFGAELLTTWLKQNFHKLLTWQP